MPFRKEKKDLTPNRLTNGDRCVFCNEPIDQYTPVVTREAFINNEQCTLIMHVECANGAAQSMICESWQNRHATQMNPFRC
jgi:hypothetical protein